MRKCEGELVLRAECVEVVWTQERMEEERLVKDGSVCIYVCLWVCICMPCLGFLTLRG